MGIPMRHCTEVFCLTVCLAGGLPVACGQPSGNQEVELQYLFAGMRQERAKLKTWSCSIKGVDPKNGSFEMDLVSNGDKVRYVRKHKGPNAKVVRVCDNRKIIAIWNEA